MKKSVSLRAFPLTMATADRLDLAAACGFDGVEVNLEPGLEYPLDSSSEQLARLAADVHRRGLAVSAVYCREQWRQPITSQDPATRARGRGIVTGLIRAAELLDSHIVLVVPGAVDNSLFATVPEVVPYQHAYEHALDALRSLAPQAERAGVVLGVENVWNKFLLSPLELARFVDEVDSPGVKVFLDVGNVARTGFPEDWIRIFGHRIEAVQVKDFRRSVDTIDGFVGLLQGDVNWPAVRQALLDVGYDGWITGEVLPAYRHHPELLIRESAAAIDAIFLPHHPHPTPEGE